MRVCFCFAKECQRFRFPRRVSEEMVMKSFALPKDLLAATLVWHCRCSHSIKKFPSLQLWLTDIATFVNALIRTSRSGRRCNACEQKYKVIQYVIKRLMAAKSRHCTAQKKAMGLGLPRNKSKHLLTWLDSRSVPVEVAYWSRGQDNMDCCWRIRLPNYDLDNCAVAHWMCHSTYSTHILFCMTFI